MEKFDVNVSDDSYNKRSKEMRDACRKMMREGYFKLNVDEKPNLNVWIPFYKLLCDEVLKIKKKYPSKNIIITQSVYIYEVRKYIRDYLGNNLLFIILNTDSNLLVERIIERHSAQAKELGQTFEEYQGKTVDEFKKNCALWSKGFELMVKDEINTYQIDIDKNVTINHVFNKAKDILNV